MVTVGLLDEALVGREAEKVDHVAQPFALHHFENAAFLGLLVGRRPCVADHRHTYVVARAQTGNGGQRQRQ